MAEQKQQHLLIEGMTCTNCALGVQRIIEKNGGSKPSVNFSAGEADFIASDQQQVKKIINEINKGGFKVLATKNTQKYSTSEKLFVFCLIFSIPLFMHMFVDHDAWINHPFVQIGLTLPVLFSGGIYFIKSGFSSLKTGVPNMDVLVSVGILSAFGYSLWGTATFWGTPEMHNYLFFETVTTITTLVLLGNVIEHRSVRKTTSAISDLQKLQVQQVNKIIDGEIVKTEVELIKVNDTLQINNGDAFPLDGIVTKGEFETDESMLSGESEPVYKTKNSAVLAGTLVINGSGEIKVTAAKGKSTLDHIIQLVKSAQDDQPAIQKLGDRISAVFVPIVIGAAALTFLISYFIGDIGLQKSLMHSIAVLVISCPCAMGLAAPTAIIVGVGKAAKKGILFKGGQSLERIAKTKNIVFDKTGTLTTGKFIINQLLVHDVEENLAKAIILSLCASSSHPISKSLFNVLKNENLETIKKLENITEIKGVGMTGRDEQDSYELVSSRSQEAKTKKQLDSDLVLLKNNQLIAQLWISDEIKPEAKKTIQWLKTQNIHPILLSGDKEKKCTIVAKELAIEEYYFEKKPTEKLDFIDQFNTRGATTMVGDGINDAPALAKSNLGISFGIATDAAINSSDVVLLNNNFSTLKTAIIIGKQSFRTIKQNFFWAFAYNTIAIPIAAFGHLTPIVAALSMAFSDVIVIGNSLLLRIKKR